MRYRRRGMLSLGAAVLAAAGLVAPTVGGVSVAAGRTAPKADTGPAVAVRVNQVGYTPSSAKVAFAMVRTAEPSIRFEVRSASGHVVLRGTSTRDLGAWNTNYGAVYQLSFSAVHKAGTYRLVVLTPGEAISPRFRIETSAALYTRLVDNGIRYFTSERDGSDVERSVLDRKPANLTDRKAIVYADPRYDSNDNLLNKKFVRIGGPVNVLGGWFDAGGGYEKFAYTASYTDALMLMATRDSGGRYPTLAPEAQFGLRWLERLYNPTKNVLYVQVGIGNGNASNTIAGDYNYWFLPQREDRMGAKKGDNDYYVEYRPVFEAARPGHKISPDLAGRFAAAFALGAQVDAKTHPAEARHLLGLARSVYALAQTHHVTSILTTFPHDYYPGSEWKSDMLWGAAEITLADKALGVSTGADLKRAGYWAKEYIAQGHPAGGDTFNLYDNGAMAEGDLLRAQHELGAHSGVANRALLADLAAQLRLGEANAKGDPFELGTAIGPTDATPHAFGLYTTNAIYEEYGGSSKYAAFAQQQMNFALGANPWGSSFVVGDGTTYPHCMQSEIGNLAGSLNGRGDIQLGAVGDGPSSPANFVGLGTVTGMKACSAGNYKPFDNSQAAYEDNVLSWPSVEPADDYTMGSVMAFSLAAGGLG
jgi:endoglucanase